MHLEAIDDMQDTVVSTNQSVVVSGIGYDDVVLRESRDVGGFLDGLFEFLNANAKLCANSDRWDI